MSDIYPRLKKYSQQLQVSSLAHKPIYFAKVDVQACFDTIPQRAAIDVVTELLNTSEYLVVSEALVRPPETITLRKGAEALKSAVKFRSHAKPLALQPQTQALPVPDTAVGSSVLVAPLAQAAYRKHQIKDMITEHVEFNLIKIGRKYYRQKTGVPQGSVLSSLLCNFFYGKLEKEELRFLHDRHDTCLLRLIDDFLLITTEKELAERFLRIMHRGLPEYGVSVKPTKSLVSFACEVNGQLVPQASERRKYNDIDACLDSRVGALFAY